MTHAGAGWAGFWRDRPQSGCLEDHPAAGSALASFWQDVARKLPKNARVLDLGTGSGAVLRHLQRHRPDLKLEGIDSAPQPVGAGRLRLRGGIAMERLPDRDARFAAVVSQFGFDYAEPVPAAREAARVLAPSGTLAFALHRADGPVVVEALGRREAVLWAIAPHGPVTLALSVASARRTVPALPEPATLTTALSEAERRFPSRPVAAELVVAARAALREPPTTGAARLAAIIAAARDDIARIDALAKAARTDDAILEDADRLRAAGLQVSAPVSLTLPATGIAFAWVLRGRK